MKRIFAFNGDADGLCALQQLHLAEDVGGALLVTGVKRRINLLDDVQAGAGDELTILDVSFHVNRGSVERLLAAGARLRYFDHHHAGELPAHARLEAHIDSAPGICTSAIVDRHLGGAHRAWAAVGAFGDNLQNTGRQLASTLDFDAKATAALEQLGVLLNYNAYGESEADLFFPPASLHRRLARHANPLDFVREDDAYPRLAQGFAEDMARADGLAPLAANSRAAVYLLPDANWARRASGTLANRLASAYPARAHAVLSPNSAGGLQVSVRAPLERPRGAATLCLAYPTGGGREAAAGINHLPLEQVAHFVEHFQRHFS